jgi:glycosyltransferase involved in cell wall biosynthesis
MGDLHPEDGPANGARPVVTLLCSGAEAPAEARRVADLAIALDKTRFRVTVTTLTDRPALADTLSGATDIEIFTVGARGAWDVPCVLGLARWLRRERVAVLHASGAATTFGLLAASLARTPVRIVSRKGSDEQSRLERRLLRSATAVVTDSEKAARRLIDDGIPSRAVNVIYDGVPVDSLRVSLSQRQAVRSEHGVLDESWLVGVAADLTAEADLGCFLQAASILRAEVPGTKFMFLGEGPQRSELQRRATVLGLDGSVIFAGAQPDHLAHIAAMDVAVLPGELPTFGLQAMGLGRPIVAMEVGANAELFPMGETGLVVPPGNPIILAHAILEVMKHPEAVERMRQRGRELFCERYAMQQMVASYEELCAELWGRHESARSAARRKPAGSRSTN